MKILEHGKKNNSNTPFIGKCGKCRCKVEVNGDEIKFQSDQRDGDFYYVICPECNGYIYFRTGEL